MPGTNRGQFRDNSTEYHIWRVITSVLVSKFRQSFHLAVFLYFLPFSSMTNAEDLHFYVTEESRQGTVIATGAALGPINLYSGPNPPRILNRKDPGVTSLAFRQAPPSGTGGVDWQLVVNGRLDRETICSSLDNGLGLDLTSDYSKSDFIIDSSQTASSLNRDLLHSSMLKNSLTDTNCVIVLRVAADQDGTQQIHPIHVHLQDINDNAPKWPQTSHVVWFRDGDPPGTKHFIPMATDPDLGINAIITYHIQDGDSRSPIGSLAGYGAGSSRSTLNQLRATDMFELVKEAADNGPVGSRLALRAKRDVDRESNPRGWDLQIIASNSDGSHALSSQLLVHVNITDVNDNAPRFSRHIYEPQLNNQKVGVVPENVPVGQVLVHLKATDADAGVNAAINYDFAPTFMLAMLRHYFEISPVGELRVRHRLDVDHKTGSDNDPKYVLPTKAMSFQVLAVDGAETAYAKTGTATVKLIVEDVDDEAPEIRVHPVHVWEPTGDGDASHTAEGEVHLAVTENDPAGQLIALVEVTDPDYRGTEMVRCNLIGSGANMFRFTQQDVTSNEYRLYTNSRLDRETNAKVRIHIECRDLADHITNQLIEVHVQDVNDHAPIFTESVYRFTVLEDDGELEGNSNGNRNSNPIRSSRNRTWLTSDGRAFVTATDRDAGRNKKITYSLHASSTESEDNRFAINPHTGQLYPLGPFDREQTSSYRFPVLAVDEGNPAFTGSCIVHVTIADVNDNPPLISSQISTTGGYLFSIRENQLPGTRIGQVEAYDPDMLPASSEMSDTTSSNFEPNSTRHATLELGNSNKLVFGLKNENDAHAFWIDPKSGVLITRAQLDREKQASYTFHVTVRDGPLRPDSKSDPANDKRISTSRRRPERSHLVSILVTVTVEDENDNDPIFIRPNATNHMVLLDPAAIPGQSLLQLHAIDPDEGPNGHVTYAIRGGNSGNLFNVDPRTGLLYLENQIPRRKIAEATAAAAAASAATPRGSSPSMSGSTSYADFESNSAHQSSVNPQAPQPTYLLALEACDQGQPRRCTHFPNLQIQLRVPNELSVDPVTGQLMLDGAVGLAGSLHLNGGGSGHAGGDGYLGFGFGTTGPWAGGLSTAEILIISLSIFFALLIVVIVITICVLRQRATRTSPEVHRKDLSTLKRVGRSVVNNVELVDQTKALRYGTNKQGICTNMSGRYTNPDSPGRRLLQGHETSAGTGIPMRMGTHPSGALSPAQMTEQYGVFSPAYSPKQVAEYQTLESWSALDAQRYGPTNQNYPTILSSPERRRYYTQPHVNIPTVNLPSGINTTAGVPYNTTTLPDAAEKMSKEFIVDLIPSRQTSQSGLSDTVTELHTMPESSTTSCSPRISNDTKAKLHAYAGFPKSSFV